MVVEIRRGHEKLWASATFPMDSSEPLLFPPLILNMDNKERWRVISAKVCSKQIPKYISIKKYAMNGGYMQ